jgi:hypothetical protein
MNLSDWHEFDQATIERHHLEGILFAAQVINKSDERYLQLFRTWSSQWHYNQLLLNCLKELDDACEVENLECVLLKGAGLLLRYYPDLGARKISDIDLLIEHKNRARFEKIFQSLGFVNVAEPAWWGDGHKSTWEKRVAGECLVLELHWQLFYGNRMNWQEDRMECLQQFRQIKLLRPELEFCYLVAHYATQHNFQKLYWLYDLHLYVQKEKLDWNLVNQLAGQLGVKRAVQMVLFLLHQEFGMEVTGGFRPAWWQRILSRAVYIEGKRSFAYWSLKHLSKDSLGLAFTYDFLWFFHQVKKRFYNVEK